MNVIWQEYELVKLKPLFGPVFTNHVQQQIAERIGLQDQPSLPSRRRGEERTSFLRCKQHGESRGYILSQGIPALKRMNQSGTLFRNAERCFPRINAGAPADRFLIRAHLPGLPPKNSAAPHFATKMATLWARTR